MRFFGCLLIVAALVFGGLFWYMEYEQQQASQRPTYEDAQRAHQQRTVEQIDRSNQQLNERTR